MIHVWLAQEKTNAAAHAESLRRSTRQTAFPYLGPSRFCPATAGSLSALHPLLDVVLASGGGSV